MTSLRKIYYVPGLETLETKKRLPFDNLSFTYFLSSREIYSPYPFFSISAFGINFKEALLIQ